MSTSREDVAPTGPGGEADDIAVCAAVLDRTLLSLRELEDEDERGALAALLGDARTALFHAQDRAGEDPEQLGELDGARHAIERAAAHASAATARHAASDDGATLLGLQGRLGALAELVGDAYTRALDAVARAGAQPAALAAPATFLASDGVPAAHRAAPVAREARVLWPRAPRRTEREAEPEPAPLSARVWIPWADELDGGAAAAEPRLVRAPVVRKAPSRATEAARAGHPQLVVARDRGAPGAEARDARVVAHARQLAHGALAEIGAMWRLREPVADQGWAAAEGPEGRLLAALDAFAALGGACQREHGLDLVTTALAYAADAPTIDDARVFVRAFVLGSMQGADAIAEAVLATRQSPAATRDADRIGFSLAAGPHVGEAMRALLGEDDPAMLRLALEVGRFRRELDLAAIVPFLSHPNLGVARAAIRAAGELAAGTAVIEILNGVLGNNQDDELNLVAAESLTCLGSSAGIAFVRDRLAEDAAAPAVLTEPMRVRYVRFLAIAGDRRDAALLGASVRGNSEAAWALGWHGHPALVEPLLAALRAGNMARSATGSPVWRMELLAADALHRITGAPLEAAQPPELSVDLEALAAEDAAAIEGVPELRAEAERMAELRALAGRRELDADVWARWWAEHGGRFGDGLRYRYGAPHTPAAVIDDLLRPDSLPRVRELGARELRMFYPTARVEPEDWVARQRRTLTALRESGVTLELRPGAWVARR